MQTNQVIHCVKWERNSQSWTLGLIWIHMVVVAMRKIVGEIENSSCGLHCLVGVKDELSAFISHVKLWKIIRIRSKFTKIININLYRSRGL